MTLKLKKQEKGFTIIEVLIVLAIAGLIMLVVFLAVPALQRNSRNTRRRNDVARVGGAVQEFVNNNNGKTPVAADAATIQANIGTLALYDFSATPLTVAAGAATSASTTAVSIQTGTKCGTTSPLGAVTAGATPRQMTVIYSVEDSSGNPIPQCTEI